MGRTRVDSYPLGDVRMSRDIASVQHTFHTACICLGGHVINEVHDTEPQASAKFCRQCGQKTVTTCVAGHAIQGFR
jgi:hypothetical protein